MRITATVSGVPEAIGALMDMVAKARIDTPRQINDSLRVVARQQRTLLSLGEHPRGTKTGSPPGSPPWKISGNLMDSVRVWRATPDGLDRWEGWVGPTAVYARIQELGGDTGREHRTHLPPRPSLYPAWRIVQPTVRPAFKATWGDIRPV
jgi:phage gpG-like protein